MEYDGLAYLSSGRILVTQRDADSLLPTGISLDAVDERSLDREHMHVSREGALMVLDTSGRRVETWDLNTDPPTLAGVATIRAPESAHPSWDLNRG